MISIDKIKQLREETGVSLAECKKALEESDGYIEKAKAILQQRGRDFAAKKTEREVGQGIIESYIHSNKKIGAMVELACETDFVAKSPDFKKLAHELCLQIVAMGEDQELIKQPWIKDEAKTIEDLVKEHIAKLGENIVVKRFVRYQI